MRVSLVSALAEHLNVEESEAANTLQEIVQQIREGVAREGRVEVPEVGTFSASNGEIAFTPARGLLKTVNAELEGMAPVVLPPSRSLSDEPDAAAEASAPPRVEPLQPASVAPAFEVDREDPEPDASGQEQAAEVTLGDEEETPELYPAPADEDAFDTLEPSGGEELETYAGEEESAALPGAWSEAEKEQPTQYVDEQDEATPPDAESEEEVESPIRSSWEPEREPHEVSASDDEEALYEDVPPDEFFDVFEDESSEEAAEADYLSEEEDIEAYAAWARAEAHPSPSEPIDEAAPTDEDETEPLPAEAGSPEDDVTKLGALAAAAAARPVEREDRPPEMHARPREVTEKRMPHRRRPVLPILLMGLALILVVGVVAYMLLLREPGRPTVVQFDEMVPPLGDETSARALVEDEIAADDRLVDEQVADETDEATDVFPRQDVAAPPPAVEEQPEAEEVRTSTPASVAAEAGSREIVPARGGWTVVVGSETTPDEAHTVARRFRDLGYNATVVHGVVNGVSRYRVMVNQFQSEREATAFLRSSPEGFPSDAWLTPVRSTFEIVRSP